MTVYGSEENLDGGRFVRFQRDMFDNQVSVGKYRNQGFINMVNWLAESTTGSWNFNITLDDVWSMTFYFADPCDAMLVRLSLTQ